jgi:hypothetical protein
MTGFGVRFAVEVAFLALLALALGLAELGTPWIVLVMAVGWVLVALVEWLAWRSETAAAATPERTPEARPEEETSWDIEEILAPLPEDESSPTALPGDER